MKSALWIQPWYFFRKNIQCKTRHWWNHETT